MVVETFSQRKNFTPHPLENKVKALKILITGASGLSGSKIAELAIKQGHLVYSGFNEHEPAFGNPVKLDITNKGVVDKTLEHLKPGVVIHAAALTDIDKCETNKELAWKINYEGTLNIAKATNKTESFLIYFSTDYIFDGEKGLYREEDPPNPINHYGYTKLKGEEVVKEYGGDGEWTICRPSVIYGTRPATGKVNFALWVLEKLRKGDEIKVLTDQYISPTLNTNLANMILEVAERKLCGVYHLAGASRISRFKFAQMLADILGLNKNLIKPATFTEMRWLAKRPKDPSLNVSKATRTLTHKPVKIEKALKKLKTELIR
jgi:dTDP-4-dehydrorhamnose reductase